MSHLAIHPAMVPAHIAIIMDGNGRWARTRGHNRTDGHVQGANVLEVIADECIASNVRFLSVYAFSTENWSRPAAEVTFLLNLFKDTIERRKNQYKQKNIRIQFCGEREAPVPDDVIRAIETIERDTAECTGLTLSVCFNYGGKAEIVRACRRILEECLRGDAILNITERLNMPAKDFEDYFKKNLYADLPPVDLLIRTGCEKRLSNFFPWQTTYAEVIFSDTLWPDFTADSLRDCLQEYSKRNRRFGGIPELE